MRYIQVGTEVAVKVNNQDSYVGIVKAISKWSVPHLHINRSGYDYRIENKEDGTESIVPDKYVTKIKDTKPQTS